MKAKNQRLVLALLALVALVGAALLAMSALKDQAAYFYTPSDAKKDHVDVGRAVRLGGMVQKGSIQRLADGVTINFVVTDNVETVPVRFQGIVPDLFKEDSGVVAEGSFQPDGSFVATNILAKHDERYMPPQVSMKNPAMHESESLKK
ncbi:cytochrome c maturation protein CcmE [Sphingomonadaceae bacterium G21617-S1]|uniref:cytochrome c maturation protein CcmE n=1 Tax=Rhizorhabdus sp. TaxID=1968843 RepID=UPI0019C22FC2|nr:cytochrome c maturation protein CcmE [Rhizorhabdus sp.]MBD3759425.1 cytochrome c maturation protein CcmE [Rhizorhabdus sp.]MCZ4340553.1 cytochrome c maturation protein CcmE [Sphingomonadaceae bacterium G21617-S1]